ncbi:Ferredoxin--NADP reductase 2 [Candidatus Hydrogenisulfobacillus filiaventi]|uniref:Ferredoxin--NADP reductase n=1 Tax=Candidatus Hydrogenisulfobacillus filiaventi TaxID=2707344 RepID=A0A6F8ZHW5_9FIRM|nr:NAD(P)/FAD-dependent oxidoreductase [Bacillota bacterium]CAB1129051.1 Ferredoxin--NADP reductase 2 [Candidatus Hydrogenisulfobacillus filiaventi]
MELFDVTVVGGGPVGLFAATMGGLHGMRVKVIESLPYLGGQLYALYPEKPIYDVAGFPAIPAKDLADALVEQAQRYGTEFVVGQSVERAEQQEDGSFLLETAQGVRHRSRTIILAVGIGAFTPRRMPAAGADLFEGRGLYYFVPGFAHFRDQRVAVVGGGDTAVDWALEIARHARQVTVIHRRPEFRAQPDSVRRMREAENIIIRTMAEVAEVLGGDRVERIRLTVNPGGQMEELEVDAVVSGLGYLPNLGPIREWGLDLEGSTIVVSPATMETSRPGIFAVGDVASYPGKVKLIATGFGEVCMAVSRIRGILNPQLKGQLPHSTSLKQMIKE